MPDHRWAAWTTAALVAAAAAMKLSDPARFAADLAALLADAGLPRLGPAESVRVAWTLIGLECAVALAIVVPRLTRAGLGALLAVVVAGAAVVGPATAWGLRSNSPCPCGIAFLVPFVRSPYATLLLRDAIIVLLVALAWPRVRERPAALAAIPA